jgi:hypothetical protein
MAALFNLFKTTKRMVWWLLDRCFGLARADVVNAKLVLLTHARWHLAGRGRPHRLPAPLIVSLTSYPARFATLTLTLRTLLRQTVRADHTVLWIAHADLPLLPRSVLVLQRHGLEIRATDDWKSYNKILPTLDAFPDAFVCTADDDICYWPTWLAELCDGVELGDGADPADRTVTCHRAHEITRDAAGRYRPYREWHTDTAFRGISAKLFPTGVGGVLYPPRSLAHDAAARRDAVELCPRADDVWLYWVASRNGAKFKTVGMHRTVVCWIGTQERGIWHDNLMQGGNDVQIRRLEEKYGYPA